MTTHLTPADLAAQAKAWRGHLRISQVEAAERLGLPQRTYQHIEQGRGFRYPKLLQLIFEGQNA
jgi:transcriptional regulator with XRE-family HTH domain